MLAQEANVAGLPERRNSRSWESANATVG